MEKKKPKLTIIETGGTIMSGNSKDGIKPKYRFDDLIKGGYKTGDYEIIDKVVCQKDSTLIGPKEWIKISETISTALSNGSNVVVLHGTDTMAYTASMMVNMIKNPLGSVVFTGSMKTMDEIENDVIKNLNDSILVAFNTPPSIYLVFNGVVLNPIKAVKVDSVGFDAFHSIDGTSVGIVRNGKLIRSKGFDDLPTNGNAQKLNQKFSESVITIRLTPGLPIEIFRNIGTNIGPIKGLVIEAFGTGNIPYEEADGKIGGMLGEIIKLAEKIPVIMTSQVPHGGINPNLYEIGHKVVNSNIIPAYGISPAAAYTKLMWCLGNSMSIEMIRKEFKK